MKGISRRDVLCGVGHAAAFGVLAAALPRHVLAAEQAAGDGVAICLSMLYPGGKKFDGDRYRDKHLPLIRSVYGDSIARVELRMVPPPEKLARSSKNARSATRPPTPPYVAAISLWIRNVEQFGKITAASGQQIQADLLKVTDITPYVQYDETIAQKGDPRSDVPVGSEVTSTYFLNKDGGRWDAPYFVDKYLPKVEEVYGTSLRRIEVTKGRAGQGGTPLLMMSASHLYIRDHTAFDAAGKKAGMQLFQEAANYTDIRGFPVLMNVQAAG
ncbi:MAG TPA: hypothetical protein VN645_11275 [Steroidobacteraceae bacterium]|nr:hypothetical protein [Steroidobacteraceae bacterium]